MMLANRNRRRLVPSIVYRVGKRQKPIGNDGGLVLMMFCVSAYLSVQIG